MLRSEPGKPFATRRFPAHAASGPSAFLPAVINAGVILNRKTKVDFTAGDHQPSSLSGTTATPLSSPRAPLSPGLMGGLAGLERGGASRGQRWSVLGG